MKMFLTIRFNKPIPTNVAYPSPGGFEVETNDGVAYQFDFCETEAGIVDGKPDTVAYTLRDEDAAAFPEIEELRHRLGDIVKLTECYVDTECYDDDADIYPVEIVELGLSVTVNDTEPVPASTKYLDIEATGIDNSKTRIVDYTATKRLLDTFSY